MLSNTPVENRDLDLATWNCSVKMALDHRDAEGSVYAACQVSAPTVGVGCERGAPILIVDEVTRERPSPVANDTVLRSSQQRLGSLVRCLTHLPTVRLQRIRRPV
jgi:hypothetical protein